MAKFDLFSSENLLISVCGHLLLVAIMITSFVVVMERAKLVAPDRIQIMEIDLNDVVVSGDETKLFNVGNPEPEEKKEEKKLESKPEKKEEPVEEPEEIKSTTLVEEDKKEEVVDKSVNEDKKVEPAPVQKKKRVVRVNREVLSLERTLTISVVDALRVAMTRCWVVDTTRADIADIRAVAHLTMRKNGTVQNVWFESAARAETDPAFAYVLDTIRAAINVCQPFRMLPVNEFEKWQKIQLTFYPNKGQVM